MVTVTRQLVDQIAEVARLLEAEEVPDETLRPPTVGELAGCLLRPHSVVELATGPQGGWRSGYRIRATAAWPGSA